MNVQGTLEFAAGLSEAIPEIKAEVEKARPVIQAGLEILQSFGPEVKQLISGIMMGMVDINIEGIKRYQAAGFTKAQSIQLMLGTSTKFREAVSSVKQK